MADKVENSRLNIIYLPQFSKWCDDLPEILYHPNRVRVYRTARDCENRLEPVSKMREKTRWQKLKLPQGDSSPCFQDFFTASLRPYPWWRQKMTIFETGSWFMDKTTSRKFPSPDCFPLSPRVISHQQFQSGREAIGWMM